MKFKYVLFLFVLFIFPLNGYSDALPLLSSPTPAPEVTMPTAHPLYVARQKVVVIDMAALGGGDSKEVKLSFFNDASLTATCTNLEIAGDQKFAWYGHVVDIPGSQVVLVANKDMLSGVIRLHSITYKIRPMGDGLHLLRQRYAGSTSRVEGAVPVRLAAAGGAFPAEEHEVLELVNEERNEFGLHALAWNDRLADAARSHSLDMATQNYFDHNSKDGREFFDRITAEGYRYETCGENIAYGYGTPAAVMEGWMNSSGHRANILGDRYCDIGIGVADHANSGNRLYWTQDFGREQGVGSCPTPTPEPTPEPTPDPTPIPNKPPVAKISAQPLSGEAQLQVDLDASESYDPDGQIVRYLWDFGDGNSGDGVTAQHLYADPGTYTVSLTVVDDGGAMTTLKMDDMISVTGSSSTDPDNTPDDTPSTDETGVNPDGSASNTSDGDSGCFIATTAIGP